MKYATIIFTTLGLALLGHSLYLADQVKRLQTEIVQLQARIEQSNRTSEKPQIPVRSVLETLIDADMLKRAEKLVVEVQSIFGAGLATKSDLLVATLFLEDLKGNHEKADELWKELMAMQEQEFRIGRITINQVIDTYKQRPVSVSGANKEPAHRGQTLD